MTRTLYLLRHAKSSWDEPLLDDFERPLNGRGAKAAAAMAEAMKDRKVIPDLVLCSTARRTQETWDLIAPSLPQDVPLRLQQSLYLASRSRLLAALARVPAGAGRIMILGHNPGLEQLALRLAGPESKPKALAKLREKYPTGALAELHFEAADWTDLAPASGRLVRFLRPRDL